MNTRAAGLCLLLVCGAAVLAAVTSATQAAAPQSITLQPCELQGVDGGGRCGTFDAFENRATRMGRTISLNVVVVPALSTARATNAVFWFEGGPGAGATQAIGPVTQQYLRGVRRDHDLVFVDQRGTGKSNPLKCGDIGEDPANLDGYFGQLFPLTAIRECRDKLKTIADLTQYTTSIAADDLDDVRAALGYPKIDLAGASYGTLAAQIYIRQHPDRVRSAFLIGVVTPDFKLPLPFAKASQNALERLVEDCAADAVCNESFPKFAAEFSEVLGRFSSQAIMVNMIDPATKQMRIVTLERESYVEHLRALLYSTGGARFVPAVVHAAAAGDFVPFQTMAMRYNLGGPATSRGMYFSVTCAESIPFITEAEAVAATAGTWLGDRRLRAHMAACAEWPRASVPQLSLEPRSSSVPVVMFSGDADGSTPPWIAAAAVKNWPNGRQIIAPHTGHQIDGPCTWNLMQAFISHPVAAELDATCAGAATRPAFATEMK